MAIMPLNLFNDITDTAAMLQFIATELALRGTAIALFTIAAILLLTKNNASERSLLWMMLIIVLALVPAFTLLLPHVSIALTLTADGTPLAAGSWFQSLVSLARQELLIPLSPTMQSTVLAVYSLVAGAAFLYLIIATLTLIGITQRSRAADRQEHALALGILEALRSRSGMTCRIELAFSNEVQSPFTWGLWKHYIILPSSTNQWREELLTQALSHELAHIQRMDWANHMLSRLVLCLYWFNPVNWWLHQRFIEDSEKACDQIVIEDTGSALTYAENLLWFASAMRKRSRPVAAALLKSRSTLYRRVQYILADEHYYATNGRTGLAVSILFAILLVAPASAVDIRFVEQHVRPPPAPNLYQVNYFPRGTPQHTQLMGQFGNHRTQ